jgi:hypothetical protein
VPGAAVVVVALELELVVGALDVVGGGVVVVGALVVRAVVFVGSSLARSAGS